MIILLLGCHIYTTIRTKGIQRKLPLALKLSITKDNGAQGRRQQLRRHGHLACLHAERAPSSAWHGSALRRPRRGAVDVAYRHPGHGNEVHRGLRGNEVPRKGSPGPHDGRRHACVGAAPEASRRHRAVVGEVHGHLVRRHGVPHHLRVGSAVQTSAITSVAQANFGVEPWIVAAIVCGSALLIIMGGLGPSPTSAKVRAHHGHRVHLGLRLYLVCNWAFIGESFG